MVVGVGIGTELVAQWHGRPRVLRISSTKHCLFMSVGAVLLSHWHRQRLPSLVGSIKHHAADHPGLLRHRCGIHLRLPALFRLYLQVA